MSDTSQRGSTAADGEQLPDDTRPREALPTRPDAQSPHAGAQATTEPEEKCRECTTDTIDDGDGNYLEPPD